MVYHGLFIGIDRYAFPEINWLNCAVQDATALHALFADTLGGGGILLTDENATRQSIQEQFKLLEQCDENDVVIIAYSGHGSETHELVTFDANPDNLTDTSISLDTLTDWFSQIPASRLICILDCCFSGGMGAKVLHVPIRSRNMLSVNHKLDKLAGNGRLIITASTDKEEAWENATVGHGLLTYYLLEALQGAEEVHQDGRVSVYRLLEYITQQVKSQALVLGKIQHPTLRGKIDDALTWEIFTPGKHYYAAFPERQNTVVTSDIASLRSHGFPQPLLDKWSQSIPSLNQLQLDAINEFKILNGQHLVVSAPTSSGKTMIGELAALKGSLTRKRSIFLLPLRALVNDKHQQFTQLYGDYGLRIIRATGEFNDDVSPLLRGQYDICLLTYEKFTSLVLTSPHLLEQVGTIIIDEVQMIANESRGVNLEFLLTLIRVRRQQGIEPQVLALSAVIGNTNGLERWLGARLLRRTERPVPLDEGVIRRDGSFRHLDSGTGEEKIIYPFIQPKWSGKNSSQDFIIPLAKHLVSEGKQVIVFRQTKGETQGCAAYLARDLNLLPAQEAIDNLPIGDLSETSLRLRDVLSGGVAFHNSNLERDERLVIEEQFRTPASKIRVIVATTTLAMGVNTPCESVVIVGLEHPGNPPKPYPIAEYKNIIGRAGRLGFTQQGESYLLATSNHKENQFWSHYILGKPESIQSQFFNDRTDPRSLIIRVLVAARSITKQGLTSEEITNFIEGSFGAFQHKEQAKGSLINSNIISSTLQKLLYRGLVEQDIDNRYTATELGQLAGETGVEVETIIRAIDALRPQQPEHITEAVLIVVAQLSSELDDIEVFPLNKRSYRPGHKEYSAWFSALQRNSIPQTIVQSLHKHIEVPHQPVLRAKKAVACLFWMSNTSLADLENMMTQFTRGREASGPIRSVKSRVGDVLPAIIQVAEILHPGLDFSERGRRLLVRLDIGIPNSITDLALFAGRTLTRGDYLTLVNSEFATIETLEQTENETIVECLGVQNGGKSKVADIRSAIQSYREDEARNKMQEITIPHYDE
jgi:helicase